LEKEIKREGEWGAGAFRGRGGTPAAASPRPDQAWPPPVLRRPGPPSKVYRHPDGLLAGAPHPHGKFYCSPVLAPSRTMPSQPWLLGGRGGVADAISVGGGGGRGSGNGERHGR
jgi:hypothetical protein